MSRALFVSLPGHGHVNPTLGLVTELIRRGEEVTYYLTKEFQPKIEAAGARFKDYHGEINLFSVAGLLNSDRLDAFELLRFLKNYELIMDTLLAEQGKYDYLVYDLFLPFGEAIGKRLNIPTVSSITTFALNAAMRDEMMGGSMSRFNDLLSMRGSLGRIKEILLMRVGLKRLWKIFKDNIELYRYVNKLEEKYDLRVSDIENLGIQKAMLNIVYTSRYFQPHAGDFDDSYQFVGPSVAQREEHTDVLRNITEYDKVIYISLGTLFNHSVDFYNQCIESFKAYKCRFIMAVGNQIDLAVFKNPPDNFIIKNFAPQLDVLGKADLFITHGGMNSVSEGLYFGVPLIIIPQAMDQPIVARRVTELGAGISLNKEEVTSELLRKTVDKVLSDTRYLKNSQYIGNSLKNAGGYKKAAAEIFALKKRAL
jgi:MGT family glycosyltransferase